MSLDRPPMGPEMRLLLACLRWPADDEVLAEIRARAAAADLDWNEVVALAGRHRVSPLVEQNLASAKVSLPEPQAEALRSMSRRASWGELALVSEVKVLNSALASAGLRPLILKGVVTSMRAYGRLGLRLNRDIDILVQPADVPTADAVLRAQGFERHEPAASASESEVSRWRRQRKDFAYHHPAKGHIVELHWRLFDNPALLPVDPAAGSERISITADFGVEALPAHLDLVYLCAHGAGHAWSRLKWLAEVDAIFTQLPPSELLEVCDLAARLGVQRPVAQAMLLCSRLLGLQLPGAFVSSAQAQRRVRWLEQIALRSILQGGSREMEDLFLGSTMKNLGHYLLTDGMRYCVHEALFDLTASPDKAAAGSPQFVAALARPVTWTWDQARKLVG